MAGACQLRMVDLVGFLFFSWFVFFEVVFCSLGFICSCVLSVAVAHGLLQ